MCSSDNRLEPIISILAPDQKQMGLSCGDVEGRGLPLPWYWARED